MGSIEFSPEMLKKLGMNVPAKKAGPANPDGHKTEPAKNTFNPNLATAPYNFVKLPGKILPSPLDAYRDIFLKGDQEEVRKAFAEYLDKTGTHDGYIDLTISTLTPIFIGGGVNSFAPAGTPVIPGSTLRGMIKNLFKVVTLGAMRPEEDFHDRHLYYRCIMTTRGSEPWEHDLKALYDGQMAEGKTRKTKPGFLAKTKDGWYIYPMLKNPERVLIREYEKAFGKEIGRDMKDIRVEWEGATAYAISGCKSPKARKGPSLFEKKADYDAYMKTASKQDKMFIGKQFVLKYPLADADWSANHRIHISDDIVAEYRDDKNRRGVNLLNLRKDDGKGGAIDSETLRALAPNAPREIERISPCYYLPDESNGAKSFGHGRHFRIAYERSIGDAVPNPLKEPTIDFADAVFGATLFKKTGSGASRQPLWASRVFMEDAQSADPVKTAGKPERTCPLLGPNPTSFQLYLRQDNKEHLIHWGSPDSAIRGYKFYWHRPGARWKANADEIAQDKDSRGEFKPPEKQMTREIAPILEGNTFTARVRFRDLSDIELGALLSVFHPNGAESLTCKLGHAKSLGLGSVRIEAQLFVDGESGYDRLFDENGWTQAARETDGKAFIDAFQAYVKDKGMDGEWRYINNGILTKMLNWENAKTDPQWNEKTAPMTGNVKTGEVNPRYKTRARLPEVGDLVKTQKPKETKKGK